MNLLPAGVPVHASLGPGETLLPEARDAAAKLLEDPRVAAVLVPLLPEGDAPLPRAARRYMAAWDARLLHRQTFYAPGARVLTRSISEGEDAGLQGRVGAREALAGWRAADAAPFLARAIDEGRAVEALPAAGVATPVARDLEAWLAWARREGAGWGALARRDARFRPFAPASWWGHNVLRAHRRAGEVAQAMRRADPLATLLHVTREAAWTGACLRAMRV